MKSHEIFGWKKGSPKNYCLYFISFMKCCSFTIFLLTLKSSQFPDEYPWNIIREFLMDEVLLMNMDQIPWMKSW
jgi:hypothetical protein